MVFFDKDKNIIEHEYTYSGEDVIQPNGTSENELYFDCLQFDSFQVYASAQMAD